jgi:hypothetical protein
MEFRVEGIPWTPYFLYFWQISSLAEILGGMYVKSSFAYAWMFDCTYVIHVLTSKADWVYVRIYSTLYCI